MFYSRRTTEYHAIRKLVLCTFEKQSLYVQHCVEMSTDDVHGSRSQSPITFAVNGTQNLIRQSHEDSISSEFARLQPIQALVLFISKEFVDSDDCKNCCSTLLSRPTHYRRFEFPRISNVALSDVNERSLCDYSDCWIGVFWKRTITNTSLTWYSTDCTPPAHGVCGRPTEWTVLWRRGADDVTYF